LAQARVELGVEVSLREKQQTPDVLWLIVYKFVDNSSWIHSNCLP